MCVTANEPKPVRVVDITYLRPSTLDDLWRDADLIARVRVVETSMKAKEPSRGIKTPLVYTQAKVEVLQQYRTKRTDAGADTMLFVARDGRVRPFGKSAVAKERSELRDDEFITDLRFRARFERD